MNLVWILSLIAILGLLLYFIKLVLNKRFMYILAISMLVFLSVKLVFIITFNILDLRVFFLLLPFVSAICSVLVYMIIKLYDENINIKEICRVFVLALFFSALYMVIIHYLVSLTISYFYLYNVIPVLASIFADLGLNNTTTLSMNPSGPNYPYGSSSASGSTNQPSTGQSSTNIPSTNQPSTNQSSTDQSLTSQPSTNMPSTTKFRYLDRLNFTSSNDDGRLYAQGVKEICEEIMTDKPNRSIRISELRAGYIRRNLDTDRLEQFIELFARDAQNRDLDMRVKGFVESYMYKLNSGAST